MQSPFYKKSAFLHIIELKNPREYPVFQKKVQESLTKYLPTGQAGGLNSQADYRKCGFDEILKIIKEKIFKSAVASPEESIKKVLVDSGNEMNPNPKLNPRN